MIGNQHASVCRGNPRKYLLRLVVSPAYRNHTLSTIQGTDIKQPLLPLRFLDWKEPP